MSLLGRYQVIGQAVVGEKVTGRMYELYVGYREFPFVGSLIGGEGELKHGDIVNYGKIAGDSNLIIIFPNLGGSSSPGAAGNIIIPVDPVTGGFWLQSEGSLWKANKGLFLCYNGVGLGSDPATYPTVISFNVDSSEPILPQHPIVVSSSSLMLLKSFYSATEYTRLEFQPYTLVNNRIPDYFASEEDKGYNIRTNFPFILNEVPISVDQYDWKDFLPPSNLVFLEGEILTVLPLVRFHYDSGETSNFVWHLHYDPSTEILHNELSELSAITSHGNSLGSSHCSVVENRLLQAHISSRDVILSGRTGNTWEVISTQDCTDLISDSVSGWAIAPEFCRRADKSNNAAAFFGNNFVYQLFGFLYNGVELLDAKIWNVFISKSGVVGSSNVVIREQTPSIGSPMKIQSIIDAYAAHVEAENSYAFGTEFEEIFGRYNCLTLTPTDFLAFQQVNCSSPCWYFSDEVVPGGTCPYEDCDDYYWETVDYVRGTVTNTNSWGGVLYNQIYDCDNNLFPANLPEYGYCGVPVPLPAGRPNLNSVFFDRHRWGSLNGSDGHDLVAEFPPLDPQIVFTSDGRSFQAILRPKPVVLPNTGASMVLTRNESIANDEYPKVGDLMCEAIWRDDNWADVHTGCGTPPEGGSGYYCNEGYGPGWNKTAPTLLIGDVLITDPPLGDSYLDMVYYLTTFVTDIYETCLVFTDSSGSSHNIVPISSNYSGARYPDPASPGDYITVTEELPIPENVWQLIPIEHLEILLVLRDSRPSFSASPRPVLEAWSFAGVKLFEYTTLVSQAIQDSVYADDVFDYFDEMVVAAGTCKWEFHGAPTYNKDRHGPRMKVSWAGENSDLNAIRKLTVDSVPNATADIIIHVSCECFENLIGEGTNWDGSTNYDYKTRVEYRQLRLTEAGFVELYSAYSERDNTRPAWEHLEQGMKFSEALPRPNTLINMGFQESRFVFSRSNSGVIEIKEKTKESNVEV